MTALAPRTRWGAALALTYLLAVCALTGWIVWDDAHSTYVGANLGFALPVVATLPSSALVFGLSVTTNDTLLHLSGFSAFDVPVLVHLEFSLSVLASAVLDVLAVTVITRSVGAACRAARR